MSTHALMNMKSQSSIQIQQKERCRDGCRTSLLIAGGCSCSTHFSYFTTIPPSLHHHSFCRNDFFHLHKVLVYCVIFTKAFICKYTYSAGMKERCRSGCRTSLLIAGVVLVPAIFHILFPPCHPYITIHFMEMIFPLV